MKKSVNQWCFPTHTPAMEMFRVAAEAGLDGVELNLNQNGDVGLTMETSVTEAESLKKMANEFRLELPSLSCGLMWGTPLSSPDEEARTKAKLIVQKQLELASAMEIRTILVVPGMVAQETSYEECWHRSQEQLADLANTATKLGVRIGIENVWNKFLLSPPEMIRFIEEVGSPAVGAYFDVGNVVNFGFPDQWIRSLGKRILKVHVKDFSTQVGNIQGFVPLLAGDVNWPRVMAALQDVGYDDYLTAEISPYRGDPYQAIRDASNQMSAIIAMTK